ncbi:MAG: hypothetical protein RRX93_00280 [Bacteroidales bacterium]
MAILVGKEYCKVDPAGRFKFPSALKKLLASVIETGFVIRESIFDDCLELYPRLEFEAEIANKVAKLNPYNKNDRLLIRKLSEGNPVELDGNDRMLIPSDQKKSKHIGKEIVLISKINIIEIWDVAVYNKMNEQQIDFAEMAAQRLGQISTEDISEN